MCIRDRAQPFDVGSDHLINDIRGETCSGWTVLTAGREALLAAVTPEPLQPAFGTSQPLRARPCPAVAFGVQPATERATNPPSFLAITAPADSSGGRNELVESVGWGVPAECLAWPRVELTCDLVEVGLAVNRQVGSFGKELSEAPRV